LAYLAARSMRWRILLGPAVDFGAAFAVTNVGYLVSNVLPLRLGDPARAVAIGLRRPVRVSAALSTVVVERVLDMLMIVVVLAATVPFVGEVGWTRQAGWLGGVIGAGVMLVLLLVARYPDLVRRALGWGFARVPRLDAARWLEAADGLLEGLAALRSPRRLMGLLFWSAVTWGCSVIYYRAILEAFLARTSWVQAAFLTCAIALSMALPSSPGAVGVFHSVARYALELPFGVPAERALAVAITAHALQYVLMCALGVFGLMRQELSLQQLRSNIMTTMTETEE
jgi:hypothetical protein